MRHSNWIPVVLALVGATTASADRMNPEVKRITNELVVEFPEEFAKTHPGVRIYLYEGCTAGLLPSRYPDFSHRLRRVLPGQPVRLSNPGPSRGPRLHAVTGELPSDPRDIFRLFHGEGSVPRSKILTGTFRRAMPVTSPVQNVRYVFRIVAIEGGAIRVERRATTSFDRNGEKVSSSTFGGLLGPGRSASMAFGGIAFLGLIGLSLTRRLRSRSETDETSRL
jgi:hypothetical protein